MNIENHLSLFIPFFQGRHVTAGFPVTYFLTTHTSDHDSFMSIDMRVFMVGFSTDFVEIYATWKCFKPFSPKRKLHVFGLGDGMCSDVIV